MLTLKERTFLFATYGMSFRSTDVLLFVTNSNADTYKTNPIFEEKIALNTLKDSDAKAAEDNMGTDSNTVKDYFEYSIGYWSGCLLTNSSQYCLIVLESVTMLSSSASSVTDDVRCRCTSTY